VLLRKRINLCNQTIQTKTEDDEIKIIPIVGIHDDGHGHPGGRKT
jgi:hypothetical protein